ncbi:MAG TPA: AI-2E family transporter [Mesorhizobium sp.]|jgi:predicted PurR-regulated permease PerM
MSTDNTPSSGQVPVASDVRADIRLMRSMLVGLFLFAAVFALYYGRDFFMPVILAFLLALMLTPIVRLLRKHGVPEAISATLLVLLSLGFATTAGYLLSGPAIDLVNNAPSIGQQLSERLDHLRRPFEKLMKITEQIGALTEPSQQPGVSRVVVSQTGIVSQAAGSVLSGVTSITIVFVLSLFLLASGTMFYEKIVQSFTRMSEKKRALRVVYDVEREISRYLLTVALINAGLGVAVALGLWALGMPNPMLWGATAALLNFLPYIGALMNVVLVGVIALISFDSIAYAMLAPAFVLLCNIVEGQFVTPMIVGRRLEINSVAIFIAIAFWSWMWGFVGALMAVPLLVVVKVFCDHFDGLRHVGNFLSAQQALVIEEEDKEEAARLTA